MKERRKIIGALRSRLGLINNNNSQPQSEKIIIEQVVNQEKKEEISSIMNHYPLHTDFEDSIPKHNISVGFLIVATGKYDVFLKPLIDSIEKFVLPNNRKNYYIFSDKDIKLDIDNYNVFRIEHKPFPYPTLHRFHFFNEYFDKIDTDQLVYIDADTLITDNIGTEILNPITVTQHCGFVGRYGTFENRLNSKSYVSRLEAKNYFGGGFYSFSRDEFYKMMTYCKEIIDVDSSRGITPIWHDESAMNKYMTTTIPSVVLSPSYHYPENNQGIYSSWGNYKFSCKILLLDKNHKEIRE